MPTEARINSTLPVASATALRVAVHSDQQTVAALSEAWDGLACALDRPFASPLWLRAWWRHLAPAESQVRVIAVSDGTELVAVLPLVARRRCGLWHYDTLGTDMVQRGAVLVRHGYELRVPALLSAAFQSLRPRPASITLHQIELPGGATHRLTRTAGWRLLESASLGAPYLIPHREGYDAWLARRPRKFRKETRRLERRLAEAGGQLERVDDPRALGDALAAFQRMHAARFGTASALVGAAAERAMGEAMGALAARGRAHAWVIRAGGHIVAVDLVIEAGQTRAFWNGAWDERWAQFGPGMQTMLAAVRDAHEAGITALDVGPGEQEYKRRYADVDAPVTNLRLLPTTARGAAAWSGLAARAGTRRAVARLRPPESSRA